MARLRGSAAGKSAWGQGGGEGWRHPGQVPGRSRDGQGGGGGGKVGGREMGNLIATQVSYIFN